MDDKSCGMRVTLDVPADATDDQIKQAIAEIALRLNSGHRALGGSGLELVSVTVKAETRMEVVGDEEDAEDAVDG